MDLQHLSLQVIASSVQQREDQLKCIGNKSVDQRVKTGGVFVEEIIEEGDIIVERTNGSVIVQVESDESADTKREEYALAMAQLRILKAEFMEILTELRKRRSLTQGPESLMFEVGIKFLSQL
ncbi:hypothetical protein J437_LFUL002265 [Ladona fulva]|uniref:Uncharacterized protein n=1 Tax=Ladona fulva TaxID=123851 RepID=A0A8K0JZB0_LADFU|nr:hypothetical protein J437_LFUL002265 [Ladona fulva]